MWENEAKLNIKAGLGGETNDVWETFVMLSSNKLIKMIV